MEQLLPVGLVIIIKSTGEDERRDIPLVELRAFRRQEFVDAVENVVRRCCPRFLELLHGSISESLQCAQADAELPCFRRKFPFGFSCVNRKEPDAEPLAVLYHLFDALLVLTGFVCVRQGICHELERIMILQPRARIDEDAIGHGMRGVERIRSCSFDDFPDFVNGGLACAAGCCIFVERGLERGNLVTLLLRHSLAELVRLVLRHTIRNSNLHQLLLVNTDAIRGSRNFVVSGVDGSDELLPFEDVHVVFVRTGRDARASDERDARRHVREVAWLQARHALAVEGGADLEHADGVGRSDAVPYLVVLEERIIVPVEVHMGILDGLVHDGLRCERKKVVLDRQMLDGVLVDERYDNLLLFIPTDWHLVQDIIRRDDDACCVDTVEDREGLHILRC